MMVIEHTLQDIQIEEKNILRALLYFDIFKYPLTKSEILDFAPQLLARDLQASLLSLEEKKLVFRFEEFYTLHDNIDTIVRRKAGNRLAEQRMEQAKKFSKFIGSFPFVRAVMLSGSISKNYMDAESDIDYFIITKTGRLWITRTVLVLFRRFFLMNSRKYFCTNYFIDTDHMEIEEKNIFTSVEVATLRPMYGKNIITQFRMSNQWMRSFLPNKKLENINEDDSRFTFKNVIERILSIRLFDRLEHWLMNRSMSHWKKTYKHLLNESDFGIAFQSTQGASRSHPNFFQKKVLASYRSKIKDMEYQQGIDITL